MPAREPSFWYRKSAAPAAELLGPAGWLYGLAVRARFALTTPQRAPVPVICVGNPVLGGGGKTPTAIAVAHRLAALGKAPHFLSRGYGGQIAGPARVDAQVHTATEVGDEPLLLARHFPAHIAANRPAGARAAAAEGADVIVMDDGFQNPTIEKDIGLLVVDATAGLGNGAIFPAGPLREPLEPQLARATALIVIGSGEAGDHLAATAKTHELHVLRANLQIGQTAPHLTHQPVLAFCGIARPEKFRASLTDAGARVLDMAAFPDHHRYTAADVSRVLSRAEDLGALPVTTEKDAVRLGDKNDPDRALRARMKTLPVDVVFDDPEGLDVILGTVL